MYRFSVINISCQLCLSYLLFYLHQIYNTLCMIGKLFRQSIIYWKILKDTDISLFLTPNRFFCFASSMYSISRKNAWGFERRVPRADMLTRYHAAQSFQAVLYQNNMTQVTHYNNQQLELQNSDLIFICVCIQLYIYYVTTQQTNCTSIYILVHLTFFLCCCK